MPRKTISNNALATYTFEQLEALRGDAEAHVNTQLEELKKMKEILHEMKDNTEVKSTFFYRRQIESAIKTYEGLKAQLHEDSFNKSWIDKNAVFKPSFINKLLGKQNPITNLLVEETKLLSKSIFSKDDHQSKDLVKSTKSFAQRASNFAIGAVGSLIGLASTVLFGTCAAIAGVATVATGGLVSPAFFISSALTAIAGEVTHSMFQKMTGSLDSDAKKDELEQKAQGDISTLNTNLNIFKSRKEKYPQQILDQNTPHDSPITKNVKSESSPIIKK